MADHDLKVQRLGQMFTEIDASTLSMVLESHSGNVQAAAAFLLDAQFDERVVIGAEKKHVPPSHGTLPEWEGGPKPWWRTATGQ